MPDVTDVYEALATEWATVFGVTVVKGRPTWARPDVSLPCAALEYMAWNLGPRPRVGERNPQQIAAYRGWFFARNEPELGTLLARLAAWAQANPAVALAGERIELTSQDALRYQPETPAQQEQHAFSWLTTATF